MPGGAHERASPMADEDAGTWGLIGGELDPMERWLYTSAGVADDLRCRVLRRAALREALEEMGGASEMPQTQILFEPMCVQVSSDGQAVRLPRSSGAWPVPAGLAFFELDAQRSRCLRVGYMDTFVFVYVIDPLRDGEAFLRQWQPQEPPAGYEVDRSKGVFGYEWRRPQEIASCEEAQPWVRRLLRRHAEDVLRWAAELGADGRWARPRPLRSWRGKATELLELLATALESGAGMQQPDEDGVTLQGCEEGEDVAMAAAATALRHFQAEAASAFPRDRWAGDAGPVLRGCARRWPEVFVCEEKGHQLQDWEQWHFQGNASRQAWMQERGKALRQLIAALGSKTAEREEPKAE
ncbi:unnamed protein product [Effrenium voratum]|nr:unnamed protein product [Effrenium voratum]